MIATSSTDRSIDPSSPNDAIEALTGRRHLSWSQLSSYRRCPRQWFFSHVEQAEPSFTASSLIFGGAIHAGVQHYYEQQMIGETIDSDDMFLAFVHHWESEQSDAGVLIRYGKGETPDKLYELARNIFRVFYASLADETPMTIIGVEETFTASLHPRLPDITARIDLIRQHDEVLHITDIKTSRTRWSEAKLEESSDQLRLYASVVERCLPESTIELGFSVVTKTKEPAVQQLPVVHDEARSQQLVSQMLPIFAGMTHGVDYANPSPMTCSTCPYKHLCSSHPRKQ